MSMNSAFVAGTSVETGQARRSIQSQTPSSTSATAPFAAVLQEQGNMQAPAATPSKISDVQADVLAGPAGLGMDGVSQESKEMAARANMLAQADFDKQRMQALEQIGEQLHSGSNLLDVARNDSAMRSLRTVIGSFSLNAPDMPMAGSIKERALAQAHRNGGNFTEITFEMPSPKTSSASTVLLKSSGIGSLAAQFESGAAGVAAIGYDRMGGTSYGKYQVASRAGSLDGFLNFLDTAAPEMAKRLRESGPGNTGSRQGAMPDEWRAIAKEEPERFEALQEKFIHDSHYTPALNSITAKTAIDKEHVSDVLKEVIWSTSVQHGPTGATRIFSRAMNNIEGLENSMPGGQDFEKNLINAVYSIRAGQFGSSTPAVQEAVRNRMVREKNIALGMVDTGNLA